MRFWVFIKEVSERLFSTHRFLEKGLLYYFYAPNRDIRHDGVLNTGVSWWLPLHGRAPRMSLYSELKRRNVFRVAIAYLALAWLLIEVAGTLFPGFGIPGWVFRCVVIVLALAFLLADRFWLSPRLTQQVAAPAAVVTDTVQASEPELTEPQYRPKSIAVSIAPIIPSGCDFPRRFVNRLSCTGRRVWLSGLEGD
jgi:hypothetical protein